MNMSDVDGLISSLDNLQESVEKYVDRRVASVREEMRRLLIIVLILSVGLTSLAVVLGLYFEGLL